MTASTETVESDISTDAAETLLRLLLLLLMVAVVAVVAVVLATVVSLPEGKEDDEDEDEDEPSMDDEAIDPPSLIATDFRFFSLRESTPPLPLRILGEVGLDKA